DTKSSAESFTVELNDLNPTARTRAIRMDPSSDPTASPLVRPILKYAIIQTAAYAIQAIYEPNNPRFWCIHLSAKATVANTNRLARPNPIAPVTIDFDSDGRGL